MSRFILGDHEMDCPGTLLFSPNICECTYRRSMSFHKSGFVHWVNGANHKPTTTDKPTSTFQPTSSIPLGEARPHVQNNPNLTEITEQELRGPYNHSEFQIQNFGNPSPHADLPVSQFPVHGFGLFGQRTDSHSSHLESQSIRQLKPLLLAIQQSAKENPQAQQLLQPTSELQDSRQESQTSFKDVITTVAIPMVEIQPKTTTQPTTSSLIHSTTTSTQAQTTSTPPTKARAEQGTTTTTEPTSTTTQSTTMQTASTQPTTSTTMMTTTTTAGTLPTRTSSDIRIKTTLYQITKEIPSSQPLIDSVKIFRDPTQPFTESQQTEQPTQTNEEPGQTTQLPTEPVQTSQQPTQSILQVPAQQSPSSVPQLSMKSAQTPQQTTQYVPQLQTRPVQVPQQTTQSVPQVPMQSVQAPQLPAQHVQVPQQTTQFVPQIPQQSAQQTTQSVPQLVAQPVQVPQQTIQSVHRLSSQPVKLPQQSTVSIQTKPLLAQPIRASQQPTQHEKASELPVRAHQPLVQIPRNRQQSTKPWHRQSQTFYDQGNQPRGNFNSITNINNGPKQQKLHQQQQYLQNQPYQNSNNNFGLDPFIAYFLTS